MGHSRPLFRFIFVFSHKHSTFYNKCTQKNVHPVYSAGIQTHDLSEHESPPITTRPGLQPCTPKSFNRQDLNCGLLDHKHNRLHIKAYTIGIPKPSVFHFFFWAKYSEFVRILSQHFLLHCDLNFVDQLPTTRQAFLCQRNKELIVKYFWTLLTANIF